MTLQETFSSVIRHVRHYLSGSRKGAAASSLRVSGETADDGRSDSNSQFSRRALALGGLTALSSSLSACGGEDGGLSSLFGAPAVGETASGGSASTKSAAKASASSLAGPDMAAARFLLQAQFSATTNDIAAVKSQGYDAWLNAQFDMPKDQTGWNWLDQHGYNVVDASLKFFNLGYVDNMIWRQLLASSDTVRKRMAYALSQVFVVSANPFDGYWPAYMVAAWWDMLNTHAFGNFRDLLEAVTLSPAMGRYLNTKGNKKEDADGRLPDENYAREVMQLFTIGLYELNTDGSQKTDLFGKPIPTYGQSDVTNLARVFTGYDWDHSVTVWSPLTVNGATYHVPTREFCVRPMRFTAANHSTRDVSFLGVDIPGSVTGPAKLRIALDTLFNHPNVAPFFARQMIQRLVTSNPSPAYINRVASVFNDNGFGVRGDLKAVWKAILTDPEGRTVATSSNGGKLREPVLRFIQLCRTLGIGSSNDLWEIYDLSNGGLALNQSPLRSPSVFNFYRPGYVPPGSGMALSGIAAPEFQIVTESSVAGYMNLVMTFLKNGFKDISTDLTYLLPYASNTQALLDWLNLRLAAGQLSSATLTTIKTALDTYPATDTDAKRLNIVQSAIFLVMASPDYLVQR